MDTRAVGIVPNPEEDARAEEYRRTHPASTRHRDLSRGERIAEYQRAVGAEDNQTEDEDG